MSSMQISDSDLLSAVGLFDGLGSLRTLRLNNNRLITLPEDIFQGLDNLHSHYLDNNLLESLPTRLFHELEKLYEMTLDKNQFITLPSELFADLSNLKVLMLDTFPNPCPAGSHSCVTSGQRYCGTTTTLHITSLSGSGWQ